ncbi:MAG: 30S ribosome-binding factor RbfA [Dysgonomonas sp.]
METTRQQKINRLIQKELGEIFQKDTRQMSGVLISVSAVRVSPDLGLAKVYLSIFPSEKGKELLQNIKLNAKAVRFDLGQKVGKQLRVIPELAFYLDDSLDYLENIDKLLGSIDKKED